MKQLLAVVAVYLFCVTANAAVDVRPLFLIVNSSDTTDKNADGLIDWQQQRDSIATRFPAWNSHLVCYFPLGTSITNRDRVYWEMMHRDIDSLMSDDPRLVGKKGFLQVLDSCMVAWHDSGWGGWGVQWNGVCLQGMPLIMDGSSYGHLIHVNLEDGSSSTFYRSFDAAVTVFACPGMYAPNTWHMSPYAYKNGLPIYGNNYNPLRDALAAQRGGRFVPGAIYYKQLEYQSRDSVMWNKGGVLSSSGVYLDSSAIWVLITRLENSDLNATLRQVRSATRTNPAWTWSYTTRTWLWSGYDMVFDGCVNFTAGDPPNCHEDTTSCRRNPFARTGTTGTNNRSFYFGKFGYTNILHDSAHGYVATAYVQPLDSNRGMNAPLAGDSVMRYFSEGCYNSKIDSIAYSPIPYTFPRSGNIKYAPGSYVAQHESLTNIKTLDTARTGDYDFAPRQALGIEWVAAGVDRFSGYSHEPGSEGMVDPMVVDSCLIQPNVTWAEAAYSSETCLGFQTVHLGFGPSLELDTTVVATGIVSNWSGLCRERATVSMKSPTDYLLDSLACTRYFRRSATDTLLAVTPGQALAFNIGQLGYSATGPIDSIKFVFSTSDNRTLQSLVLKP
jgi:hypothetical protein